MSTVKTINIIFDGQCGFCIRSLRIVRALDLRGALQFHDANRPETFDRFPELRGADVEDAIYTVVGGEAPQRGFFAFRRVLWCSPLMWPLIPLFYFSGASLVGPRVYSLIARNRKSFGCESDLCPVPAGPGANVQREE